MISPVGSCTTSKIASGLPASSAGTITLPFTFAWMRRIQSASDFERADASATCCAARACCSRSACARICALALEPARASPPSPAAGARVLRFCRFSSSLRLSSASFASRASRALRSFFPLLALLLLLRLERDLGGARVGLLDDRLGLGRRRAAAARSCGGGGGGAGSTDRRLDRRRVELRRHRLGLAALPLHREDEHREEAQLHGDREDERRHLAFRAPRLPRPLVLGHVAAVAAIASTSRAAAPAAPPSSRRCAAEGRGSTSTSS